MNDRQLLELAQTVCTSQQYQAYELHSRGLSERTIAHALGLSRSTIRSRLENAKRRIAKEIRNGQDAPR